jgi:hypothetical protein
MTTYRATELHENDLPWSCWDQSDHSKTRPMEWGITLVPTPVYENPEDIDTFLYYEWKAILPDNVNLPDWITRVD